MCGLARLPHRTFSPDYSSLRMRIVQWQPVRVVHCMGIADLQSLMQRETDKNEAILCTQKFTIVYAMLECFDNLVYQALP